MADTPIKDGIPAAPAQATDKVPVSRVGLKNTLNVQDFANYVMNPTEGTLPYRGSVQLKDSPVVFDDVNSLLVLSIPAVYPRTTINATTTQNIESHVDRVYTTGTITVTLEDRASSGIPVTIRNKSGTTTIASSVGTVENDTLTAGQSSTVAFDPIDEVWYEE